MNPQPKPVKRRTVKAKRRKAKAANIGDVREVVIERDRSCRVTRALGAFEFVHASGPWEPERPVELAHLHARGMGGNATLSRDTTENTLLLDRDLHKGPRSHHSGHLRIKPLTERGMDGPCAFTFYEVLPSEAK